MAYYYAALHNYNSRFCITPSAYSAFVYVGVRCEDILYKCWTLKLPVTMYITARKKQANISLSKHANYSKWMKVN